MNTLKQINIISIEYLRRLLTNMNKIVKIAQVLEQERANAEEQWNNLHKTQRLKNKMLHQQMGQIQAMNDSLERENERLWKMITRDRDSDQEPILIIQKKKQIEVVDLTQDDNAPAVRIKKEHVVKVEQEEGYVLIDEQKIKDEVVTTQEESVSDEDIEEPDVEEPQEEDPDLEGTEDGDEEVETIVKPDVVEEEPDVEEVEPDVVEEEPDVVEEEPDVVKEEPDAVKEEPDVVEEQHVTVAEAEVEEEPVAEDKTEEEEVFLITIDGKQYYTTNEKNGMIYASTSEGDVGDEVGYFENGEAGFYE